MKDCNHLERLAQEAALNINNDEMIDLTEHVDENSPKRKGGFNSTEIADARENCTCRFTAY